MGKVAFVFPGQGSQYVGMGREFFDSSRRIRDLFAAIDERLGEDLSSLCFTGPEDRLGQTANTQPAVLMTSLGCLTVLQEAGVRCDYVAGHSLGEYSALAAAGILSEVDAAWLVRRRGRHMEEAVPSRQGSMAAVMGLALDKVEEACREAGDLGTVGVANLNCPGQVVISGWRPAVERAGELCRAAGAKRVVVLGVSGPFHSLLMQPAAEKLGVDLEQVDWHGPAIPMVFNCCARPVSGVSEVKEALIRQLTSPVRWQESIEYLLGQGVEAFVEVGPGKVLSGLIRRIAAGTGVYNVEDGASLDKVLASLEVHG